MADILMKKPTDVLDYDIDFAHWLPVGDAIIAASTAIEGSAVVDNTVNAEKSVKVWISGGTDGETCHVEVTAVTAGGRTKEHCFKLRIRDRC